MFEVVDCLYAESGMVSNGKTGYLFYPFNNLTGMRHASLQTFHIKNVRLYRSDVEVIANLAAKSVDKEIIIEDLTSKLAAAQAEIAKLNCQLKERPIAIDEDLKEIPHQSRRTVLRVMYAMAKLTKLDNSAPYGKNKGSLNCEIVTLLQNESLGLEHQSVGKWLTEIDDVSIIKK